MDNGNMGNPYTDPYGQGTGITPQDSYGQGTGLTPQASVGAGQDAAGQAYVYGQPGTQSYQSDPYGQQAGQAYQQSPYGQGGSAYQPDPYGQGGYGQPGQAYMPEMEQPMTLGEWVVTLLILFFVPCVNLVMLFVWAFSSNTKKSKSNWAKAMLIFIAVVVVLELILSAALGSFFSNLLGGFANGYSNF